jgi:molybdate transport system substrate-binding protein
MTTTARLLLAAFALALAGCGGDDGEQVVVSAAASLTDAFAEMKAAFEAINPDVDVSLNLAGSALLAEQIVDGAPIDVFVPAALAHMERVLEAGLVVGSPRLVASNRLEVATPEDNPAGVTSLGDLADPSLLVGLCDPAVPCGMLAREVLTQSGVVASVDSYEPNVRSLLTKIGEGELDAGIVYATDVLASEGRVQGIPMPEGVNVMAHYPIAAVVAGPNPYGARLFVEFVLSAEGQSILTAHGFGLP